MAACFVQIVKILGECKLKPSLQYLRRNLFVILGQINKIVMLEFTKLLRDEDEEVLQALVPHIGEILELFLSVNVLNRGMYILLVIFNFIGRVINGFRLS